MNSASINFVHVMNKISYVHFENLSWKSQIVSEKEISLGLKADFQIVKEGKVIYTIKNGVIQ